MALKVATKPAAAPGDVDETPEVPASIPRHAGNGNPKIRNADATAKFSYYARASSFGKVIEDNYNLGRWAERAVVFGLSRRSDLLLAAQAVAAFEDRDDEVKHREYRDELQRIAGEAKEAAGATRAAARGTEFHKLSERLDKGHDLSFVGPQTWAALQQWRRMMAGFEILGTEQFVVNDELGAAGTYDRLLSPLAPLPVVIPVDGVPTQVALIEPGETIIADLKSGRTSKYFGPGYSVQQWIYASGTPYEHVSDADAAAGDNGRRSWSGDVFAGDFENHARPRRDWALIPHVPIDNPEDAGLLWVNLERGRQLAELALAIREARKFGDLFYEAAVPAAPAQGPAHYSPIAAEQGGSGFIPSPRDEHAELRKVLAECIACAVDEVEIDALYEPNQDVWTDELTAAVRARLAELAGVSA